MMYKQTYEIWKDIPGYEGLYQASSLGRIRSLDRTVYRNGKEMILKGKIKKQRLRNNRQVSYMSVKLCKNGKETRISVHFLVAITFIGTVNDLEVCHIDSNPMNNKLENLKLDTHEENIIDQYRNGVIHGTGKLSYKEAYQIRELYRHKLYNQYELSDIYGITQDNVSRIVNYKTFKFVNEDGEINPSKTAIIYGDIV